MTYISLPSVFGAAGGQPDGRRHDIKREQGGVMVTVATLLAESDIPVDAARLAQNLAAMLNGHNPVHHLGEGVEMLYQTMQSGVDLRFRASGPDGGVSKTGALVTMSAGFDRLFEETRTTNPDVVALFMGAAGRPERRAKPRAEAAASSEGSGKRKPVFSPSPKAGI